MTLDQIDEGVAEQLTVDARLNRLYAELAALKRAVILERSSTQAAPPQAAVDALHRLRAVIDDVSERWSGPGAVEEIRAQRGP